MTCDHMWCNDRRRSDMTLKESESRARDMLQTINNRYYTRLTFNVIMFTLLITIAYWTSTLIGDPHMQQSATDSGHPQVVIIVCATVVVIVAIGVYHDFTTSLTT
jgi:hypothetical protein